jgi:hypothetical protein
MKFSKGDILVPKWKQFPDCAIVVDGYDQRGRLLIHPMGGGIQGYLDAVSASVFRAVDQVERASTLFHSKRFVLADSEEIFQGWADGRKWNGWEMPGFEKAEAIRLIEWLGDKRARFDESQDAFITISQDGEEELWRAENVIVSDGGSLRIYPIGAGAWIWDEVAT